MLSRSDCCFLDLLALGFPQHGPVSRDWAFFICYFCQLLTTIWALIISSENFPTV